MYRSHIKRQNIHPIPAAKIQASKKTPETDAIFANVKAAHARSDNDPQTLAFNQ